nr:MAG TPA: HK97 Family Phage Portal Protein [Caudoviricetes sp.]
MAKVSVVSLHKESRRTESNKYKGYPFLANGEKNDYPTMIELLVGGSATAKACAGVIADFIYGKGFSLEAEARATARQQRTRFRKDTLYINDKRETPNDLLKKVARSLSYHKGVFVQVNYNQLFQKTSVQVLPYRYCRLGARDSNNYRGKVLYYENWDNLQDKKEVDKNVKAINLYDPSPKVIQEQVDAAGGWDNYKGQVYFLNLDRNDSYPLAWADVVLLDCESEMLSTKYTRNGFKKGFFGTYAFVTSTMNSDEDREDFRDNLRNSIGVEAEQSVFHFELEMKGDKLEDQVLVKPIESNVKADLFEYADKKTANNIRKTYGNIPPVLIDFVEGKLGNTSGDSLKEARIFMQEQMQEERQDVQEMFEELFDNFAEPISSNGLFEIMTNY